MKIIDILNAEKPSLSFEVFPPKSSDNYETVSLAVEEIAKLEPSYMSVTYGAGGGTSEYTYRIAREIMLHGTNSLAHLSCISSSKEQVQGQLEKFAECGIENILALRGDIPDGLEKSSLDFHYAYELIDEIRSRGDFCIGGACYPECHPESESVEKDLEYLKIKAIHGCDFFTTQMFFDNDIFYRFIDRLQNKGIGIPVVAGIMPITSYGQLDRMVRISGNELPKEFLKQIDRYKDDPVSLKNWCMEYALLQARDIYQNGFKAVHVYSMNKPDVARYMKYNLEDLIR